MKQKLIKAIHAAMRDAGYERSAYVMRGTKTYECFLCANRWHVKVPGSHSTPMMQVKRRELMAILEKFSPAESYDAGVDIPAEE